MDEKSIETKEEQPTEEKKAYTPPVLTLYGKLAELTAGGTGTSRENKNDPTPQPDKRP